MIIHDEKNVQEKTENSLDQKKVDQLKLKQKYGSENPCSQEQDLSIKCLEYNGDNKHLCKIYFDNYKECKGFWAAVEIRRKQQGIHPSLPGLEEREKIKAEYFQSRQF